MVIHSHTYKGALSGEKSFKWQRVCALGVGKWCIYMGILKRMKLRCFTQSILYECIKSSIKMK